MESLRIQDIETPALLLDMAAMEENLRTMASFFEHSHAKLRPHFKNYRVLKLATRQIAAGAIGITCAHLWEVERLAAHGVKNLLLANEVVGEIPIRRIAELSRGTSIIVAVDNAKVLCEMGKLARSAKTEINVVVDIDLGLKRCGVPPGEAAVNLAKLAVEKGLRFRGLMGYEGHLQPLPPGTEKERLVKAAMHLLIDSCNRIEREGIPVEIVSCGGTGDYSISGRYPRVTENQPGSYLLMDKSYEIFAPEFKPTLTVLATVVSKTPGQRIVVDAGVKALSGERGLPSLKGLSGLRLSALHAEHAPIEIEDSAVQVDVGDKVEIWVQYHDATVYLHDRMYGLRNGRVEEVFTIERRGSCPASKTSSCPDD